MSLPIPVIGYLSMGWYVFPIKPGEKTPLTKHGHKEASNDPKVAKAWWDKHPDANVGVACGPSGLVVVDVDNVATFMGIKLPFPSTLSQRTGSGGIHLVYLAPEGVELGPTVGRLPGVGATPGVDLRAGSSYVVVPPSTTEGSYEWLDGPKVPREAPEWLRPEPPKEATPVEDLKEPDAYAKAALAKTMGRIRQAKNGERNHTLNKEVYGLRKLVGAGHLPLARVIDEAKAAAKDIGLSDFEATRTIRSALGLQEEWS